MICLNYGQLRGVSGFGFSFWLGHVSGEVHSGGCGTGGSFHMVRRVQLRVMVRFGGLAVRGISLSYVLVVFSFVL